MALNPVRLFMDDYGFRYWVCGVAWIVGVIAVLAMVAVPWVEIERHVDVVKCRNQAHAMGRDYRSGILEGCLVRLDDGTFIPLGNLRTNDVERTK